MLRLFVSHMGIRFRKVFMMFNAREKNLKGASLSGFTPNAQESFIASHDTMDH